MVFFEITIGNFGECKYKFPKEENATDTMPYCDSQMNILKRVNETEQIKSKISELTIKKTGLEFKKQKGKITPEEEEELKQTEIMANTYSNVMALKPYFVNENTGEVHLKALKKLGDEAIDKFKKTSVIPEGEYKVCDIAEKDRYRKAERGELLNQKLYDFLKKQDNKAIKFNATFGYGYNEERVYVYPSVDIKNVLIIEKVGRTKLAETIAKDMEELAEVEKMKELLESITLQAGKLNRNKIAGSLDD
jgi:hypothetical protein